MDPVRERQAHELFKRALDVPPDERSQWVERACDGSRELRDDVVSLLEAHASSHQFLETPAVAPRADATPIGDPEALVGKTLGRYCVLDVLGSGGMGAVYRARQLDPTRIVALKVLRPEIWSPSVRRRFVYEAQILARLTHPNIARVFDVDTHAEGSLQLPFFAMEYVEGGLAIDAYVRRHDLDRGQRIELFCTVCDAVQHGHQKGVIHRDLKPANILVDATGQPKVIDFGVARLTGEAGLSRTLRTEAGQLLGTLQYMSPEQCAADPASVDVRADVYALGVVLYELLCKRSPYDLTDVSIGEAVRIVQDRPPRRPASIDVALRGDLETIVLTALEKEPSRRYESAAALRDDLQRFLNHEPIRAHPPSLFYQARLFARRNRLLVASASAVALALAAGLVGSLSFAFSAEHARREAVWQSYVGNIAAAESAHQAGEFARMRTKLAAAAPEHRGWEWQYLSRLAEPSLGVLWHQPERIDFIQHSSDGSGLFIASRDGAIRMLDERGAQRAIFRGHGGTCNAMVSADDALLVTCSYDDGRVLLWDVHKGHVIRQLWPDSQIAEAPVERFMRAAFDSSGTRVAVGTDTGRVFLWDVDSGRLLANLQRHDGTVRRLLFHPTSPMLITCGDDGEVRFLDLPSMGEAQPPLHPADDPVLDIALQPGTEMMAASTSRGTILLFDLDERHVVRQFEGHPAAVRGIQFSPDGSRLFSAGAPHAVAVWDVATGDMLAMRGGHNETVSMLSLHPDGSQLATSSWDGTVRLWDTIVEGTFDELRVHDALVQSMAFSPDSALLLTGSRDNTIVMTDVARMQPVMVIDAHEDWIRAVAFSRAGDRFVSCSTDRTARVFDAASGDAISVIRTDSTALSAAFSPDGARVVVGEDDGDVAVYDANTGAMLRRLHRHADRAFVVSWSNDGSRVASASWDGSAELWDGRSYRHIASLTDHDDALYAMTFSPDSTILVTGGRGQDIGIWNARSGARLQMLRGHGQFVTGLAFSPDGTRLASASWFQTIKLWDTSRWEEVLTLHGESPSSIRCMAFSPDGTRIATGLENSIVQFWDIMSPVTRRELRAARSP